MKLKFCTFIFFMFLSEVIFGQVMSDQIINDSSFISFKKKIYLFERVSLDIDEVEPTDTISLILKKGTKEKFKLRYIESVGNPPSFEEGITIGKHLVFINGFYRFIKFGTDFIVIHIGRNTGMRHDIKYYYQIIRNN